MKKRRSTTGWKIAEEPFGLAARFKEAPYFWKVGDHSLSAMVDNSNGGSSGHYIPFTILAKLLRRAGWKVTPPPPEAPKR